MGVTASEEDILRDQSERSGLQKAIADVETALSVSTPGTRRILENSLEGMKSRVTTLDKKIGDAIHERGGPSAGAVGHNRSAGAKRSTPKRELRSRLTADYWRKEFFTKQDFKTVGSVLFKIMGPFERRWQRRNEPFVFGKVSGTMNIVFTDAPTIVQEKEAKMAFRDLTGPSNAQTRTLEQIPEADRADFIRAYQSGDRNEIGQVLSRDSFRQNMAVESSTGIRHKTADLDGKSHGR